MSITLNGTTGITSPDINVTAQTNGFTTTGNLTAADLTLSGGVYLGGTGSANLLDDYEQGTFVPTIDIEGGGTISGTGKYGFYTKVGRVVTVHFGIAVTSTSGAGSGAAIQFSNLPFTTKSGVVDGYPVVCRIQNGLLAVNGWYGRALNSGSAGRIEAMSTSGTSLINSSNYIGNATRMDFTITYVTDA